MGNYDQAIQDFENAIVTDPKSGLAWARRGEFYFNHRRELGVSTEILFLACEDLAKSRQLAYYPPQRMLEECERSFDRFERIEYPTWLKNGYSPYDAHFGKGRYDSDADNTVVVHAPEDNDIVFLLKDVTTGQTIRNEFIRKGSTFSLTSIPYGLYEFSYFAGRNWSQAVRLDGGRIEGGFTRDKSFSISDKIADRMNFRRGYYGSYEITLSSVFNGNLETEPIDEASFFK